IELQFRAAVRVGPKLISGSQWTIDGRRHPIIRAARLEGYGAFGVGEPCNARGWIVVVGRCVNRHEKDDCKCNSNPDEKAILCSHLIDSQRGPFDVWAPISVYSRR